MPQPADKIIVNANVFTADPALPQAEAVAIQGQHIIYVGKTSTALDMRGPATQVINGQGLTLMPGFIDSHFHLLWGSLQLGGILLEDITDLDEFQQQVKTFAAQHPNTEWLSGSGLQYNIWPEEPHLPRLILDQIVTDRPLVIMAFDVHTAWANTEALRRANLLTSGEPVAPNSEIVRDPDGVATGELRELGAYQPVYDLIPSPSEPEKYQLLKQGLAQAASLGITSVHNMDGNAKDLARYAALADVGELTTRVYCPFDIKPETPLEALIEAEAMRQSCQTDMVQSRSVKFFMDGVVENYTALLLNDYVGQPGQRGGAIFELEHFIEVGLRADQMGLQIKVHAVGDGAVRQTLNGLEEIRRINGPRDSRHRIEHIELLHPDDAPRFADLGVIASIQPSHATLSADDPDPWRTLIDPSHWGRAFPWQMLRKAGAHLVFGSDWPVVTPSPFVGMHYALNRQPWGEGLPAHRQNLTDTLLAYTRDAAYAEFQEHQKGQLSPGTLADMVLLSKDIFTIPSEEINNVQPLLTICDGRVVFEA